MTVTRGLGGGCVGRRRCDRDEREGDDDTEPCKGPRHADGVRQPEAAARPCPERSIRAHRSPRLLRRRRPSPPRPRPPPRRAPRRSRSPPRHAAASASSAAAALRLGLGGLERCELLLGRKLAALGTTSVFTSTSTSSKSSIGIEKRPMRLIGSAAILRRSTRTLRVRQISSATSEGVTEPKSDAGRPGLDLEPQHGLAENLGDLLRLLGGSRLVLRALLLDPAQLRDAGRRRVLGEPPRQEVVAGVAAGDVDDLPAQARASRRPGAG